MRPGWLRFNAPKARSHARPLPTHGDVSALIRGQRHRRARAPGSLRFSGRDETVSVSSVFRFLISRFDYFWRFLLSLALTFSRGEHGNREPKSLTRGKPSGNGRAAVVLRVFSAFALSCLIQRQGTFLSCDASTRRTWLHLRMRMESTWWHFCFN